MDIEEMVKEFVEGFLKEAELFPAKADDRHPRVEILYEQKVEDIDIQGIIDAVNKRNRIREAMDRSS